MNQLVSNKLQDIRSLCIRYSVEALYLIGSATQNGTDMKPESDVDFLLRYKKTNEGLAVEGFDYFDLLFGLEELLGRKVDLVVAESIKNEIFRRDIQKIC